MAHTLKPREQWWRHASSAGLDLLFPAKCIATGGLAKLVASESATIEETDELLTLRGLKLLYDRNVGGAAS